MAKPIHQGKRETVKTVAQRARAGRSAYVMKTECLAEIARFRLMEDNFMPKGLENAPERWVMV